MFFFISPNFKDKPEVEKLAALAASRGYKVLFPKNLWGAHYPVGECGIVLGEQAFAEYLAQEMRWNLCQNSIGYMEEISYHYAKRLVKIETIANAKKFEHEKHKYRKELRAADNDRLFDAGIYNDYPEQVPEESIVMRSVSQEWTHKYRFLIQSGKVIDGYKYKNYRVENVPGITSLLNDVRDASGQTCREYLESFMVVNATAPACVIDVGFIDDVGWAIIDTHPVWMTPPSYFDTEAFLKALITSCTLVRK